MAASGNRSFFILKPIFKFNPLFDIFNLGVGWVFRTAAGAIKPTIIVTRDGNTWTLRSISSLKNIELTATEGIEFDESIEII